MAQTVITAETFPKKELKRSNSFKSKERSKRIADFISMVIIVILAALVMLPIWWIFRSSLMTNSELYAFPPAFFPADWLFSNYAITLKYFDFWLYLKNSFIIITPSVIAGTATATICGYAFGRLRFPGKKFIFTLCVGSMFLPAMVTLIPLYIMWTRLLGLGNTYWPLILPYFCGGGAFNIFLIRQFAKTIPKELDESATIDGAGYFRIMFSIMIPLIRPAMIVVALLLFISMWNDLLQQLIYINKTEDFTIAIGLTMFRSALKVDWGKTMCATCMSFSPGVILYLIGQKYFVEGIAMTGMKN